MKTLSLIFILFPVILVAQKLENTLTYKNDKYSIEYPSSWILNDSGENGTIFFIYPEKPENSDVFKENINLAIKNLNDPGLTIEDYKNLADNQISEMLSESRISLSELKNKNGFKFHHFVADGISNGYRFKTIIYTYLFDNQMYSLTYVNLFDNYDINNIEIPLIMDSFKLKKR